MKPFTSYLGYWLLPTLAACVPVLADGDHMTVGEGISQLVAAVPIAFCLVVILKMTFAHLTREGEANRAERVSMRETLDRLSDSIEKVLDVHEKSQETRK